MPHVGCPCRCSFCNQTVITGQKKAPTAEETKELLRAAGESMGKRTAAAEIAFFGGSFTAVPREYMIDLLEIASRAVKKYGFAGIRCSTRPDAVNPEILEILKQYGVTAIELGAQSMCNEVLRINRRGHTAEQIEDAAMRIRESGFELGLQMMTGLYGDDDLKAAKTAKKIIMLSPDTVRIYPTIVLRGTMLEELMRQKKYAPQTLEEAVNLCATLVPEFEKAAIRVIRVGLHAERELELEKVAGPYHPAFRELVESKIFLSRLVPELSEAKKEYTVSVNPKTISVALGHRRINLKILKEHGFDIIFIQNPNVPEREFKID